MRNCEKDMQLVPFGKYKGQPVEVMQMDTGYCDWLSKQDWFREQYGNVYNQIIINNFTEPSETPEHNRLQMRFLDENFVESFVSKKLRPAIYAKYFHIENIQFEHYGWDVCIEYSYSKYSDDEADRYNSVCFEIKPCLGDDFPAVLRQMKKNSNRYSGTFSVCIIDEFSASGATYEQVQQMFRASKFSLLKFSDFE